MKVKVIIEPPEDHPNREVISGERIPVTLEIPDSYPWHEPWLGWKVAEVIKEEQNMGAEQYMIVSEESLRDEDGPHEVDVAIVPDYGEIAKDNRAELEKLAQRLSDNFDTRYVVISMTQYWEANDKRGSTGGKNEGV